MSAQLSAVPSVKLDHATFFSMMAYLCKAMCSVVTVIKSKYRKDISIGKEVKVVMPKLIPKIKELYSTQQVHTSH